MVDTRDLKSLASNGVQVRLLFRASLKINELSLSKDGSRFLKVVSGTFLAHSFATHSNKLNKLRQCAKMTDFQYSVPILCQFRSDNLASSMKKRRNSRDSVSHVEFFSDFWQTVTLQKFEEI